MDSGPLGWVGGGKTREREAMGEESVYDPHLDVLLLVWLFFFSLRNISLRWYPVAAIKF